MPINEGLAVYVRKITEAKHGTPVQFATRCKDLGLSWVALAGPWQDARPNGEVEARMINSAQVCLDYGDALAAAGVTPYVWGYPSQGGQQRFCELLLQCAGERGLLLLDPELGANPQRSAEPAAMQRADAFAAEIVQRLRDGGAQRIGLSTYGLVPRWFPLRAFLRAGVDFAGGQTYTDNATVGRSIASFRSEMRAVDKTDTQLVPNFGLFTRVQGPDGGSETRPKTPEELRSHLMEFIEEGEPVHALIGWADNFLTTALEPVLVNFSALMRRGATALPVA